MLVKIITAAGWGRLKSMSLVNKASLVNKVWRINKAWLVSTVFCVLLSHAQAFASGFPERLIGGQQIPSLAPIIEQVSPAVVNIATYSVQRAYNPLLQSPFFRHFFSLPEDLGESRHVESAGSGVIIDAQAGYILTNHHVIAGSNDIEVNLQDGRKFAAKLIGSDAKVDVALLQITAENLVSLPIADSRELAVGDFVMAIGNPFGLGQTVTSGIVSALGRNGLGIQGYEDFIQTDAAINPGNSGGALIDLNGRLVGINSAIIAPAGGNVGIGFAIPTEVTNAIMAQLIAFGEVKRGGIGAGFQDLTPDLAEAFALTTFQGAVVAKIVKGGSADEAGLKSGDIVVKADGRRVTSAADINNRVGLSPIGKALELEVLRAGAKLMIAAEIRPIPIPDALGKHLSPYLDGATLQDFMQSDQSDAVGVLIKQVAERSNAAILGLQEGDIIFGVNRTRIRSIEQLQKYLKSAAPQAFRLRRGSEDLILYIR